ncbi:uncharacterized protein EI97DRAFT_268992 [Westerdykella ornata]|uniref:Ubiquitin-like domain-containing protein n=1 Tax=Westerdykella ornata TaxID=318751 RepID=A0A6A6J665_WESOR|nr:uncharacterized protein EI97DRAFT_268992 [Westerdykella ornata]KAF2271458.1 hypothetical protein EI97DRAFT_268992 [Westerdykella ornata]
MPRVTISISGPNRDAENHQDLLTLDLPPGLTVKDLKAFVEAETTFPVDTQRFFLNGQALGNDAHTLEDAGIKDGEMLALLIRRPPQGPSRETPNQIGGGSNSTSTANPVGRPDPEAIRQSILSNPGAQAALRHQSPELFAALNDRDRWRNQYLEMARLEQERDRERDVQYALLNEDPFNPEAQQKIEDLIRRDRIAENLQHAYEHNPECRLQPSAHAVRECRSEWAPNQGIRRFGRPEHHHVP